MRTFLLLAVGLIGIQHETLAQDLAPDVLFLTGEADSGGSIPGAGGEVEWLHAWSPKSSVTLGGASTSRGDAWWSYGTVGAFTRRREGVYSGRVSLGSGRQSAGGFAYIRYVGSASLPVARKLFVEAEGQYARVARAAVTVFGFGALYSGVEHTTVRIAHYTALSDVGQAQYVSARGEVSMGRTIVLGGMTATVSSAPPVDVRPVELTTHASAEYFFGTSVGMHRSRIVCAAEVLPQAAGHLVRLNVTLKIPLGPRRGHGPEVVP